jgi:hypothetical protein
MTLMLDQAKNNLVTLQDRLQAALAEAQAH